MLQSNQYIRPIQAFAEASRGGAGEPIDIRMCRLNGQLVYDVKLLRHDGRVVAVFVDAARGAALPVPGSVRGADLGTQSPHPPPAVLISPLTIPPTR